MLRTRLALREAGWHECEELIWYKPDAPPLGSKLRPRRAWESILWFAESPQPYCDLKACGRDRTGSASTGRSGSPRRGQREDRLAPGVECFGKGSGWPGWRRVVAPVGANEPGVDHPAMFPLALAER